MSTAFPGSAAPPYGRYARGGGLISITLPARMECARHYAFPSFLVRLGLDNIGRIQASMSILIFHGPPNAGAHQDGSRCCRRSRVRGVRDDRGAGHNERTTWWNAYKQNWRPSSITTTGSAGPSLLKNPALHRAHEAPSALRMGTCCWRHLARELRTATRARVTSHRPARVV